MGIVLIVKMNRIGCRNLFFRLIKEEQQKNKTSHQKSAKLF